MTQIGSFTKSGAEFKGEIATLTIQAKNVRIVPETNRTSDNAPAYRVLVGKGEAGAAWQKQTGDGRPYLSVALDDPTFQAPLYASLFQNDDGGYSLVWTRNRRRERD